jgi:hypothetical protein
MPIQLTDPEIAALIAEPKPLPDDYQSRIQIKPKRGHKERELDFTGENGGDFRLILRQSLFNVLDFSIILSYLAPKTNHLFRLRRYNGKSHEHTNALESQTFYEFHIHTATERYQLESGGREDTFAEPTDKYPDFQGAIRCMLSDCNFILPAAPQGNLFEEES